MPTRSLAPLITTIAAFVIAPAAARAATIFVRADAPPGGNGSSWASASNNLRTALNAANAGDEVWIARGLYTTDPTPNRNLTFVIKSGVRVLGGFAGNETAANQRPADNDPAAADPAFDTVLTGEIGAPEPGDNTLLLVDFQSPGTGSLLDRVVLTRASNSAGFGAAARIISASPTITNTLIADNTAGAASAIIIDNSASTPIIEDCIIARNTGGAVNVRISANPTFRRCTFDANSATSGGGGAVSLVSSAAATFENCDFTSNNGAGVGGGAIRATFNSSVTVRDCNFTSNFGTPTPVASGGGAININASTLVAERCSFTSNSAHQGGAIDFQSGSLTVKHCVFHMNSANSGGAAIIWNATNLIEDTTFTSNTASAGGALHTFALTTIARCQFRSNSTTAPVNSGGAIYVSGAISSTDSTFDSNRAQVGGAFYFSGGTSTLERCTITNNVSNASGGVAFHPASGGTVHYRNSLIARNRGSFFGSVAYLAGGASTLTNCTVADNSGGFEAFYTFSAPHTINNSIVRNAGTEFTGAAFTVTHSNIDGGHPGAGNINAEPAFIDPINMNYRLAAGSPGIDAANNALLPLTSTTDIEGNNRFMDDPATSDTGVGPAPIADIGAYEFQPAAPAPCPGDANEDRAVNFLDITTILANFGATYTTTGPGDSDTNAVVNFLDITTTLASFGATCS